jgi:hypothetical protein
MNSFVLVLHGCLSSPQSESLSQVAASPLGAVDASRLLTLKAAFYRLFFRYRKAVKSFPAAMNHYYTSPVHDLPQLSSPSSAEALREGSGFIQRSAQRRAAFARARSGMHTPSSPAPEYASFSCDVDNSLVCDTAEQLNHLLLKDSSPVLLHSPSLVSDRLISKKKLDFQPIASNDSIIRRVSFGSTFVQPITPRSEKVGAIGICFEQEDSHVVVRSVNPGGPAATDGRIVPGDTVIEGVFFMSSCCLFLFNCRHNSEWTASPRQDRRCSQR